MAARRLRLAVVGWGRLGQACAAAIEAAPELQLAGVVRRAASLHDGPQPRLREGRVVGHVRELGELDAALVCVPADAAGGVAHELLQQRVDVVDCAALAGAALQAHHEALAHDALRFRCAAVFGAGWEPGALEQLQQWFHLLIPQGRSTLQRRVAAGLHHSAAADAVPGVKAALCSEQHGADGSLQRYVYVELARGATLEAVRAALLADPLFAAEPTEVFAVDAIADVAHETQGVMLERLGSGTQGPHASVLLEARMDPVAFSAAMMVDAARQLPGRVHGGWRYTPFGLLRVGEPGRE